MASKTPPHAPVGDGFAGDPRLDVADALTAILLHAEAIGRSGSTDRLAAASRSIAKNAKRAWRALEELERQRPAYLAGESRTSADTKA